MKCGRSTSVLTAIYQFYILSTVWHEAHKICTLMIVRHCFVLRRTLYITPTQWVIVSHSPMYNFSNAKWQQQKALLSQWCKSQRTSGNVESLSMAQEEGLDAGWRGGGRKSWDGVGWYRVADRWCWLREQSPGSQLQRKAEQRGLNRKRFHDREECGLCSPSGLQSVSRVPLVPLGRATRPRRILRSLPLTYPVLMHPLVPASALQCALIFFATGLLHLSLNRLPLFIVLSWRFL